MVGIVLHYASEGDIPHVLEVEKGMAKILGMPPKEYGVKVERRCASAHKTPDYLMQVVACPADVRGVVLGRQPAAPPAIDANDTAPVVTLLTDGQDNPGQVYSSLNVPSGVACMTAPPWPEAEALALLKIAALKDERLKGPIKAYQEKNRSAVMTADETYRELDTPDADVLFKKREEEKKKK